MYQIRIHTCYFYKFLSRDTWLHGLGIKPNIALIADKLRDRNHSYGQFLELYELYEVRKKLLLESSKMALEYRAEMYRFLPVEMLNQSFEDGNFWSFLIYLNDVLQVTQNNFSRAYS